MNSLGENWRRKTPASASIPTGLQRNTTRKKIGSGSTPTPILPPLLAQNLDWPDLSRVSSLPSPSPSSTHDDATFYYSMDERATTAFSETESDSESSPAPPVAKTESVPDPTLPQKILCLFCRSTVPLNGKSKPPFILTIERRKMLTNLCTHMHLNPSRIPVQCSEEKFPFCNMCIKLLKEMWEKEKLIREAQTSIDKLVEEVERTVADAEILIQSCSSSTVIAEQRGFTELREMILDAYRNKLMMKKVVRENKENPGNPSFRLVQNSSKVKNITTSIPAKTGNVAVNRKTTKQNSKCGGGVNQVNVKMENAEDEQDKNNDNAPARAPVGVKKEFQLPPSQNSRTDEGYMPPPKLVKVPKRTQSYEGVQFFETRAPGNVELIQCSKCLFYVNSKKYRAEGKLPITSMKQHILRVHKNIRTTPTQVRKTTSPVHKCVGSGENPKTKRGLRDPSKLKPSSRIFTGNNVRTEAYLNVAKKPLVAKKKQRRRRRRCVPASHECPVCDRIFQRKCAFVNHFKSHKNQRPIAYKKEIIDNPEPPPPSHIPVPSVIIPLSSLTPSVPTTSSGNDVEVRREMGAVRIIRNGVRMTMTDLNDSTHSLEELCQAVGITPRTTLA